MPPMADGKRAIELPREPLDSVPDDPTLWAEVPLELLVRYGCVPVRREGERIVLAFGSPDGEAKLDEIEYQLERPVEAVLAPAERVAALLRRHRGGEILLEQASEGLRLQLVIPALVRVVGMMPIGGRVVQAEREFPLVACLGDLPYDVLAVRRIHRVVVRVPRVPQAKTVVVLGREADVPHSGGLGDIEPSLGIEPHRVPLLLQLDVLRARHAAAPRVGGVWC